EDWLGYLERNPQGQQVIPFVLELAADLKAQNERLSNTVDRVRRGVEHITGVVRSQQSVNTSATGRTSVDLRQSIADAAAMLADAVTASGIELQVDCVRAPVRVSIHECRFRRMLVNLVTNAIEAIDELGLQEGVLEPCIRIVAYRRQEFVVIDVVDNGVGIEPECRGLLFAPTYTTKQHGRGLGLHSVANYVTAAGGGLEALSDGAGKGTTMRVMLPQASPASEAGHAHARPLPRGTAPAGRAGTREPRGTPDGSARDGGLWFQDVLGELTAVADAPAARHARVSIGT
ncbi:MAG: ATP-binding protein, partial [Spirochaetaceae bacterium]|nr:ATP-binding protein [Spirochaetaceae bacterium]